MTKRAHIRRLFAFYLSIVAFLVPACLAHGEPASTSAAVAANPYVDVVRALAWPIAVASSAEMNDSERLMLEQVQIGAPADYAVIGLGEGKEWLTSRLYIAAVMMERMRGLQTFVMVEQCATADRRFVAVASVRQLRWALARRYPWLEAAWTRASISVFPAYGPVGQALPQGAAWLPDPRTLPVYEPLITSDQGAFAPSSARLVVSRFLEFVQETNPQTSLANKSEWVSLRGSTRNGLHM